MEIEAIHVKKIAHYGMLPVRLLFSSNHFQRGSLNFITILFGVVNSNSILLTRLDDCTIYNCGGTIMVTAGEIETSTSISQPPPQTPLTFLLHHKHTLL
jgi:hypothetical protein